MKNYKIVLLLLILFFSCVKKKAINIENTNWERLFYNKQEMFFPYLVSFQKDTVVLTDGNNFKHRVNYNIDENYIKLFFNNNIVKKIPFKIYSDSVITINDLKFYKNFDESLNLDSYELINYQTKDTLIISEDSSNSYIIHLVKENNRLKVILNDRKNNVDAIPYFLLGCSERKEVPQIILYVGKGIKLEDLLQTYQWINTSGEYKITLVTKNQSYDKFYSVRDYISIDDSLVYSFSKQNNIPLPRPTVRQNNKRKILKIDNRTNFEKLPVNNDSIQYLFQIRQNLKMLKYLKLIDIIKGKKNIKKEIIISDF